MRRIQGIISFFVEYFSGHSVHLEWPFLYVVNENDYSCIVLIVKLLYFLFIE
jgi:hypothetical protein